MSTTFPQTASIFAIPQEKFSTEKLTERKHQFDFYFCGLSRIELEETKQRKEGNKQNFRKPASPRGGTPPPFFYSVILMQQKQVKQ